ncbi:MAG: hypothetical protein ACD_7C00020G0028 [uncultured bacterium]|nr:MAG: hypothetical protein ACD_7C00020G0028 [uncultured bacterium]HBR79836.1 hypothetical protein [Candidatus Moranbacteria bacterium]
MIIGVNEIGVNMPIKHNEHPIEQAFTVWINNYPESFHPLDMDRFYVFVKTVCRYSRKLKDDEWLRNKIKQSGSKLDEDDIDTYCYKFVELQNYHRAFALPIYTCINR